MLNVFGTEYFLKAHAAEALHEFGELGVIFLMFVAGLEVQLSDCAKAGKPAVLSGILGVVFPIILGSLVVLPFGYALDQAIFIMQSVISTEVYCP